MAQIRVHEQETSDYKDERRLQNELQPLPMPNPTINTTSRSHHRFSERKPKVEIK